MALHIRAIDHTLVANHLCSREAVLGCNPATRKIFTKGFRSTLAIFQVCPSIGTSYTVHYVVFHGTNSVKCFDEPMRVSIVGLKHFLRQFQGSLSLFPWSH